MRHIVLSAFFLSLSAATRAGGAAPDEPVTLTGPEVRSLVSDRTTDCLRIKDDAKCAVYYAPDGTIKREMDADGERRNGVWKIDDEGQLCVQWEGKTRFTCFWVIDQRDGSYHVNWRHKHKSTVLAIHDGNARGL